MSFSSLHGSVEGSRPIELYRFAIGSESFLYSAAEDDITLGADTYTREAVGRTGIAQGPDATRQPVNVTMPAENSFAQRWLSRAPGQPGSLTILVLERDETTFGTTQTVAFKGIVRGVDFPDEGKEARIQVTSALAALSNTIPRYRFSPGCNHFHYGDGCGVAQASHQMTATVTAESGRTITVPGAGAFSTKFPSGYVEPTSFVDFRTIRSQSGDVLTLSVPFPTSMVGQQVKISKGCDHDVNGDCSAEYGNVLEYGGFPTTPGSNPFEVGI